MDHTQLHRRLSADLPPGMLYALLRLRVEVLVVEQACAYQELDGRDLDPATRHYWLSPRGAIERPGATLRMLELAAGTFRIDRICAARHTPVEEAVRRLLEAALGEVGDAVCHTDVPVHLIDFYRSFGFVFDGTEFVEHGVPRIPLLRAASARVG